MRCTANTSTQRRVLIAETAPTIFSANTKSIRLCVCGIVVVCILYIAPNDDAHLYWSPPQRSYSLCRRAREAAPTPHQARRGATVTTTYFMDATATARMIVVGDRKTASAVCVFSVFVHIFAVSIQLRVPHPRVKDARCTQPASVCVKIY